MIDRIRVRDSLGAAVATLLIAASAGAQCPAPDAYEPNDVCSSAVPLTGGSYVASNAGPADEDWYEFQVPAGGAFDLYSVSDDWGAIVDLGFTLYLGASCPGTQVATTQAFFAQASLDWENTTGSAVTVRLAVREALTHGGPGCVNYTLDVAIVSAACAGASADDAFEPNGTCREAAIVTDGAHTDLYFSNAYKESDYFKLAVHDGQTLAVDVLFSHADANLDVFLARGVLQCLDPSSGVVASAESTTDDESLVWANDTGLTWTVFIDIEAIGVLPEGCAFYELHVQRFETSVGDPLCFGDGTAQGDSGPPVACPCGNASVAGEGCANSHGYGAILQASGSADVAADDLVFTITQGRQGMPCMVLQGGSLVATAFKSGVLCVGYPTRRVEVVFLDGAGAGSTTESVVTNGNVLAGQTRIYQAWYRDPFVVAPCTERSNLTQALEIDWN